MIFKTKDLKRIVTVILILSALLTLSAGCSLLPQEEEVLAPPLMEPVTIEYRTVPVERGTIIQQSRMTGIFAPEIQQALSFENQGGRLKEIHVRIGEIVEEGQLLVELDSGPLSQQIRLQEIEVEKNELHLEQLKANQADRFALRRAELDLEQQRIRLENMRQELANTQIFAPFDGEITYLASVPIGEFVNAYQSVVRLADLSKLILITTADQASELPLGVEVEVEISNELYEGEVIANPSTLFSDPDERLQRAAIIRVDEDLLPDQIASGTNARITYVKERREDVLVLPRNRLNLMSGRRYVNVLEDGIRVEKDVEVGLMTDTQVEIVDGLEEGDLIITN